MIVLDTTTRKLQFLLGGVVSATQPTSVVSYADVNAEGQQLPSTPQLATANGATAVDICAAPEQSYVRSVNAIVVYNADSATVTVTVRFNDNGTMYILNKTTLLTGESLVYTASAGWFAVDANGAVKTGLSNVTVSALTVTGLTNGRVVLAGASGALQDSAGITYSGTEVTFGAAGTGTGKMLLKGTTSGTVTVQPQGAAGTFNFNLPITAGTSGQFLTSGGGGSTAMTWTTPTGLTAGTTYTLNPYAGSNASGAQGHGLAQVPDLYRVKLECLTSEHGWAIGDVIDLAHYGSGSLSSTITIGADATNMYVNTGSTTLSILAKTSPGAENTITAANWKMTVTPYKIG